MVTVRHIEAAEVEAAMSVLADSFASEAFTRLAYDFSDPRTRELFGRLSILKARVYLAVGNYLLVAIREAAVVGVAVLQRSARVPLRETLRAATPGVFGALPLLSKIRWRKALPVFRAMKHAQQLPEPYLTLEAIAVHPDHQGSGIGKALMEEVHRMARAEGSGTYLFTADEKNSRLYSRLGYETIEIRRGGELTVYHMFRANDE